jgi:hypothetical protein
MKTQKADTLVSLKGEIQKVGLSSIKEYLVVDPKDFNKEMLIHLFNKAKIGMQFEREMNLSKRAIEMNHIRIFKLTAKDRKEMKELIKKTMPHYL